MQIDESFDVIPGFFRNYVSALIQGQPGACWKERWFFLSDFHCFLIGMLYFYRTTDHRDRLTRIGVVLMMAGTLGNFIDRLIFQYVRDFLDFIIFGYDFPVFNVADISLCVGVGSLFYQWFWKHMEVVGYARNKDYRRCRGCRGTH